MFLQHTIPYSQSESLLFFSFNSNFIFPLSNFPRLLNAFFSNGYSTSYVNNVIVFD